MLNHIMFRSVVGSSLVETRYAIPLHQKVEFQVRQPGASCPIYLYTGIRVAHIQQPTSSDMYPAMHA